MTNFTLLSFHINLLLYIPMNLINNIIYIIYKSYEWVTLILIKDFILWTTNYWFSKVKETAVYTELFKIYYFLFITVYLKAIFHHWSLSAID